MKAMKLVYLALTLMLVGGGCGVSKDHLKDSTSLDASDKQETAKESPAAKAYKTEVMDLTKELETSMGEMSKIINEDSTLSTSKQRFRDALANVSNVTNKFNALTPGDGQKDIHELILRSLKIMRDGIEDVYVYLDNMNNSEVNDGFSLINQGSDMYMKAIKKLY
ncbi:hypothetical protein [Bacillus mycoides]|uniref:hypothetical protein n=1 Tax=Bacillus mycoides TaxID=1405 RepID=UPI002E1B030F|nr:hypothetical protein [Bacillus mycoides]HDR7645409.1 hypothetical protein [Bacillus mycoides]